MDFKRPFIFIVIFSLLLTVPFVSIAKAKKKKDTAVYKFKITKKVKDVSVKSQGRTGTCWSFATTSFLESEVLRKTGIKDIDLSEMYTVRNVYNRKAKFFVRLHGVTNFSSGGQAHDVIDQMKISGMVPESIYSGKKIGEKIHNHGELETVLNAFMNGIVKKRGKRLSPRWLEAFNGILDVYLGKRVKDFKYKGKKYTPKTFVSDYLKLNADDYIELASCTNVPFYTKFRQLLPDNWTANSNYYNVPIDTLESIVDNAIKKGYSVCWDADVSDRYFGYKRIKGWAIVPEKNYEDLTKKEKKAPIKKPLKEKVITQEMRQKDYDNYSTTDDHLMHLVGIAKDQNGKKFYLIKNSWGTDNQYKGYYYISKAYFRLRTINIMINKEVLSKKLKKRLNL